MFCGMWGGSGSASPSSPSSSSVAIVAQCFPISPLSHLGAMKRCRKSNREGMCPQGCTPRRLACHRYFRGECVRGDRCRFVHCAPGCNAEGNPNTYQPGRGYRSPSPRPPPPPPPPPMSREIPPEVTASLGRFGLNVNGEGVTLEIVRRQFHALMLLVHPDKAGDVATGLARQVNEDKEVLDKFFSWL